MSTVPNWWDADAIENTVEPAQSKNGGEVTIKGLRSTLTITPASGLWKVEWQTVLTSGVAQGTHQFTTYQLKHAFGLDCTCSCPDSTSLAQEGYPSHMEEGLFARLGTYLVIPMFDNGPSVHLTKMIKIAVKELLRHAGQ